MPGRIGEAGQKELVLIRPRNHHGVAPRLRQFFCRDFGAINDRSTWLSLLVRLPRAGNGVANLALLIRMGVVAISSRHVDLGSDSTCLQITWLPLPRRGKTTNAALRRSAFSWRILRGIGALWTPVYSNAVV